VGLKGSNDAGVTWLKTYLGDAAVNPTAGTSYSCQANGNTISAFMHVDNSSALSTSYGGTRVVYWDDDATTAWTSGADTLMTLP
jgi:hypothetical protein